MQQEKGQAEVVVLIIAVIAVILFFYFKSGSSTAPSTTPSSQEETTVSPKQESSPTVIPPSYYSEPIPDTIPPFRSNPQPSGGLISSTREVFLILNTDESATCRYSTVSGVFYEYMQHTFSETGGTFHSTLITALNEGGVYNYYVRCVDGQGNKNSDDFAIAFWVNYPTDFTPPVLSNAYPSGDILPVGTTGTIVGVSTNEPASCRYSWTQGTAYNSMSSSLSADGTKQYHTANITGLTAGNSYSYFVRCKDLNGNANTGDVMVHFKVAP